ncbi:MAG: serine/threonine protein kinase [Anaerolineae bacterium]|nr:serine/threonine protein kinase [Anaerolineae bacterium]
MQALQPGTRIKSYTLEALLGRGASGEVWRATDGKKTVAIKFMNEALLTGASAAKHRQRLEREVKALTTLQHPNIPALYEYDLSVERPYLVMQFIAEPSYDLLISSGDMLRVPVARRLQLLEDLARALTAAHAAGIFHRDLKPGNMNGIETPYLLDFSIALEEEDIEHTSFNIGTTIYMTPDEEPPDRLSDNYSFAIVAYEVLFGVHPIFPPEDKMRTMGAFTRLQTFQRLKNRDWRFPSRVPREELPVDLRGADLKTLDSLFERAMGAREQRYQHLSQFIAELRAAILVPANVPFMQQAHKGAVELPAVPAAAIPKEAGYTQLEAGRAEAKPKTQPQRPPADSKFFTQEQMGVVPEGENYTREMAALPAETPTPPPNLIQRLFGRLRGKKDR